MEHLSLEEASIIISNWVETNLKEALYKMHIYGDKFKFGRILNIPKMWKENDYWIVDATVEYYLEQTQMKTITFQINQEGYIIGYNLHE